MKTTRRLILLSALAASAMILGACSRMGVDVWERDVLALSEMQPGYNTVDHALDDHIYFSKEAASGGRGFGGGGCGCN